MSKKPEPLITKKKKQIVESHVDSIRRFSSILNESSALNRLNPEDYESAEEYLRVVDQTDLSEIVNVMNSRAASTAMFPSGWNWTPWGEEVGYPAKLAAALVRSEQHESVTDLGNVYYNRRNMSKEAMDIFRKDAISNPGTKELMTEFGLLNLGDLIKKEPETMRKIFLTFSPDELEAFKEAEEGLSGGNMDAMLAQIGI